MKVIANILEGTKIANCILITAIAAGFSLAQSTQISCPKIILKGPPGVTDPGQAVAFSVESKDLGWLEKASFAWKTSSNGIIEGQGTNRVQVSTTKNDSGTQITAFVKVTNSFDGCSAYLSETAPVGYALPNESFDEFGALRPNDLRSRLDTVFISLINNPRYEGIFVISFPNLTKPKYKQNKLDLIYNHILFRRFDSKRISFYLEEGLNEGVKIWQVPAGFDYSELDIDESKLIKSEEYISKRHKLFQNK